MCDKKNNVLFTETERLVLSPDFKLLDESQVLIKVPRHNNMYNFDLKNVVPSGGLTCLFAKAIIDESNLWHRRLGHINFKTMNKLVKGNLIKGLPSKLFINDHTCVACQKGKQHNASCKTKLVSFISQPLQMLHMDLFGPTSIRSINHKIYYLVVTDDYSRCDNGTEFKNNDMNQFCRIKAIKREFSVARTPQQNGVAERTNKTLIEAAKTMLEDSLLPTTFWAEAVNPLGKFNGKADEGFFVGYSINSKAFRVFNTRTRKVEENLHITFLENKPNVAGSGPDWLFDIDLLTNSMNYEPVTTGNQTNKNASIKDNVDAKKGYANSTNRDSTVSPSVSTARQSFTNVDNLPTDPLMPDLEDIRLVDLPKGKHAIGTKWVYRNKKDERGIVVRNKARLVAQGYTQEEGIDYDEVFAPVARIEAIRLFLAYASFMGFIVYQMDVKSAFLYGTIEEEVYVCQPPSFEDPQFPNKVYKVEKALYGLHQAPRAWYETLSTYLLENGFRRGIINKTLFIKKDKGDIMLVQRDDGIFISQDKYVVDILKKFDFVTMKIASTPIETHKALLEDKEAEDVDVHLYRSMIGSLMYLTASRPDIMFVVCACTRFQVTPKVSHLHDVRRIFRYLKGQPKLGLWCPRDSPFDLEAFLIFWNTANSQTVNDVKQIHATVDGKTVVISESSVRSDLHFNDEDGITCLTNTAIFENLALMGTQVPRSHGGAIAQTRSERASKHSYDSPLPGVNTLGSDEGSLELKELMDMVIKPSYRVFDLEKVNTAQKKEIAGLKRRVHLYKFVKQGSCLGTIKDCSRLGDQ
ncbi:retrovirus-related pol polyprotein from transposon TNT 1-94 [Tanacetum coccineum]